MASNFDVEQISGTTCTICLDVKENMKIVGICKHFFCVDCLEKHFDRRQTRSGFSRCPSCQGDCAVPHNGVDGLIDHSPNVIDEETVMQPSPDAVETTRRKPGTIPPTCQMCEFKNTSSSKADFVCKKCDLLMCGSCNEQHQTTLANAQHVVMRLASNTETEDKCARHKRPLQLHCNTCQCPVCSVCVTLEHGDHEVMEMELVISQMIKDVKSKIENSSDKVADFQQLKAEVTAARELILNRRGKMIQQVEEAAEVVIKRVLEHKEKQKQTIKDGCDVNELTDLLERLDDAEKSFQKEIQVGRALLTETSTTPVFLDRLKRKRSDLDVVIASDDIGRDVHWKRLKTPFPLFQRNEDKEKLDLGKIIYGGSVKVLFLHYKHHSYQNHSVSISCVVAGGQKNNIALALSTTKGTAHLVHSFDYGFKLNNEKKLVFGGIKDMAVTRCCNLAILQQNKPEQNVIMIVKNILSELDKRETPESIPILTVTNNAKCISLSVNVCGQFVVLWADDQGSKRITVLGAKGHTIDECLHVAKSKDLRRVACGGRYFFVLGVGDIYVYEIKRGKVVNVVKFGVAGDVDDISATPSDDLFASISDGERVNVVKLDFLDTIGRLRRQVVTHPVLAVNRTGESRIDVQDNWMIVSHGYTFDLFNLKTK